MKTNLTTNIEQQTSNLLSPREKEAAFLKISTENETKSLYDFAEIAKHFI